ncbi:MAG TPA: alanine racemase [Actinophytocola sp.]|uniref:alanine racemase n=1 Tax=Actinophytocola sp. TaxID=1872138 RepID=UPI002F9328CA
MAAHPPRAEAIVDLDALRHNVTLLAERAAASGAATMAVVKADGYGHGALPVARAALEAGATWLGACSLAEALTLRGAGITAPILSWLEVAGEEFAPGVAANIDLTASSVRELGHILGAGQRAGKVPRVHLKIDTGLSRNGCPVEEWPELVDVAAKAHADGYARIIAIWSHLACADEPGHASVDVQATRFQEAYEVTTAAGLRPLCHLANSAATLNRPDLHFDLVRVGIAMYGLNPLPYPEDLRPVMTFRSSVSLTKRIAAGEAVSYGQTWTAPADTNLALVPVGYADGIPRLLSGRLDVWLAGRRRPVVGRVCMDQIVVDCGDDLVPVGEEVVLFGEGTHGEPTATEWANTLGTIDYEIVTGMYRPRVTRTYRGSR